MQSDRADQYLNSGSRLIITYKQPSGVPLKLFVGQLPPDWEEEDMMNFFRHYGEILDGQIIRKGKESKRCGFVKFASMTAAEETIKVLASTPILLPGADAQLQLRWADGEEQRLGVEPATQPRLFVGSIPHTADENIMTEIFSEFGRVEHIHLTRDSTDPHGSKGIAFVTMDTKESCLRAIEGLNECAFVLDSEKPLEVRIADRRHKGEGGGGGGGRARHAGGNAASMLMPMYVPSSAYPVTGTHMDPGSTAFIPKEYTYGTNKQGPPGCNLFLFHIPSDWTTQEVVSLFSRYGEVVSVRIATENGRSRGYGFLSFANADDAKRAVSELDGFQVPGNNKRLKVDFKKDGMDIGGSPQADDSFKELTALGDYRFAPY
eukprot:TRINITY_DN3605_c0_g1_i1.p1 TRINITY_DN3605_c0_g1~~TRINITY_DN3605_c0_g1_i1.p1  ORF type:complete len:376 (-),score=61.51 TRINITY_DN3605_c0_g1_i1:75-1202(-)